jgi:hypothetical protein
VISGQQDWRGLLFSGFFFLDASGAISLEGWATGQKSVVIMVDMLASD